jgi:hypothetical protein
MNAHDNRLFNLYLHHVRKFDQGDSELMRYCEQFNLWITPSKLWKTCIFWGKLSYFQLHSSKLNRHIWGIEARSPHNFNLPTPHRQKNTLFPFTSTYALWKLNSVFTPISGKMT